MFEFETVVEQWIDETDPVSNLDPSTYKFLCDQVCVPLNQSTLYRGTSYLRDLKVGSVIDYSDRLTSWSHSQTVARTFSDELGDRDSVVLVYDASLDTKRRMSLDISGINKSEQEVILGQTKMTVISIDENIVTVQ